MLQEKAILIDLNLSMWTARKYDKKVSDEVADKHGTSSDVGRYNKATIDRNGIKPIQKVANEARTFHYENTLPWFDSGGRILPTTNYFEYMNKMRELKDSFESAVATFTKEYAGYVKTAKERLKDMFNPEDYPTGDIADRFSFYVQALPIPASKDFRVNISSDEIKKIKEEVEGRLKTIQEEAVKDLWSRMYKVVNHMSEILSSRTAKFKNSLIGNLDELVKLLPKLNITDDPNLEAIRKEIEKSLTKYDPDNLRVDKKERKKAAKSAKAIMDKMKDYM